MPGGVAGLLLRLVWLFAFHISAVAEFLRLMRRGRSPVSPTPTLSPTLDEMLAAARSSRMRAKVSISVTELKNILLPLDWASYSPPAPPLGDISTSLAEWKSFEEEFKQWHELHGSDTLVLCDGLERFKEASLWELLNILVESWYNDMFMGSRAIGGTELLVGKREYSSSERTVLLGKRAVLLGVYDKQGMVRLANYMVANQVSFGMVVDDQGIAFCKRIDSKLLVCVMKQAPFTALGFMLHLSLEDQSEQPSLVDWVYDSLPDSEGMFAQICSEFPAGQLKDPEQVVSRLQFLKWRSLEAGLTPIRPELIRCYIVRTKYKGRSVVLKLRDLSRHYVGLFETGDWRSGLQETMKEVDVYMRLRKCQGSAVPRLLSYGFVEGGMFTFLMLSDERVGDVDITHYTQLQHQAIARGGMHALHALHARGLLYGRRFGANDLVLSCSEDGTPLGDAKLVGFSEVKICDSRDSSFAVESASETLSMRDIIDMLGPRI